MENDQWTFFLIKQQARSINVAENPCIKINLTKLKQLYHRRPIWRSIWGCFIDKHIGDISMPIIITDDWSVPHSDHEKIFYLNLAESRDNITDQIKGWSYDRVVKHHITFSHRKRHKLFTPKIKAQFGNWVSFECRQNLLWAILRLGLKLCSLR